MLDKRWRQSEEMDAFSRSFLMFWEFNFGRKGATGKETWFAAEVTFYIKVIVRVKGTKMESLPIPASVVLLSPRTVD